MARLRQSETQAWEAEAVMRARASESEGVAQALLAEAEALRRRQASRITFAYSPFTASQDDAPSHDAMPLRTRLRMVY